MPQHVIGAGPQFIELHLTGTEIAIETAAGLRKARGVELALAREVFRLAAALEGERENVRRLESEIEVEREQHG